MFNFPMKTVMAMEGRLPMARSKPAEKKPDFEVCLKAAEAAFKVGIRDMKSRDKSWAIAEARSVAIFFASHAGGVSFSNIARKLDWSDHSSVRHARSSVAMRLVDDATKEPKDARHRQMNVIFMQRFGHVRKTLEEQGFNIELPEFCELQAEAEKLLERKKKTALAAARKAAERRAREAKSAA